MLPSNGFSSNNCFPPLSAGLVLVKFWQGQQVLWCCPPEDSLLLTPFLFFFIQTYPSFISLLQLGFVLASQPILFFFLHGKRVAFSMSQHLWLLYVVFTESVLFWEANKHWFWEHHHPRNGWVGHEIIGLHILMLILAEPKKRGADLLWTGSIPPLLAGSWSQDRPALPGLFFWGRERSGVWPVDGRGWGWHKTAERKQ